MFGNSTIDNIGTGRSLQSIPGHKQMFASTLSSLGGSEYNNSFKIRKSGSGSYRNTLGKLDIIK